MTGGNRQKPINTSQLERIHQSPTHIKQDCTGKNQIVAQKPISASAIIFHQAKKQFAALKHETKSCTSPTKNTSFSVVGITPVQKLPCLQNRLPTLKIAPSLSTMVPKNTGNASTRAKVTGSIVMSRRKTGSTETPKTNSVVTKTSQTPKLVRVKTAIAASQNQPKHTVLQPTSSSSNRSLVKKPNRPVVLRTRPGMSNGSPNGAPLRSQLQKPGTTKTDASQEMQRRQPGAIKVISVNSLNARQPKTVANENTPNKPLRLAPSLSKTSVTPKTPHSVTNTKTSPLKPFASVTNLMSHERFGKPAFVASIPNRSN